MSQILFGLLLLSMLAVVGVLVAGVIVMAKGGETSQKYSNKLMNARVILQGIAIAIFVTLMLVNS